MNFSTLSGTYFNIQLVIYSDRACVKTLNVKRLDRKILTGGFTDLP